MISDEAFDRMREAWKASIPEQYRHTEKTHDGRAAIILPPPPEAVLERFLTSLKPHLCRDQVIVSRAGKPGKKRRQSWMVMAA